MLTDLEKYLSDNRRRLDVEITNSEKIWKGIIEKQKDKDIPYRKKYQTPLIIRIRNIAALVIFLFSIGFLTKNILEQKNFNRQVALSDISEILGRKEMEYKSIVALKTNEAVSTGNIDNLIIEELYQEIERLDIIYDLALIDLRQIGYNEKIINTIFDTYEKKIRLLELIILESNKQVSNENKSKIIF
jgi:hypothetical protein